MSVRVSCVSLALVSLLPAGWPFFAQTSLQATEPGQTSAEVPVEPDMHEFMEYVFQPTFNRLKPVMSAAPADNKGWKAIKADSLILAEAGNLLLVRRPKENAADWVKHSVEVRNTGGQLYKAAKAKDYPTARKHYEAMVANCNACHKQFADGEHMLTP